MAEPGDVLISQQAYDQVHAKLSVGFEYLGEKRPKNFAEDVAVYRESSAARLMAQAVDMDVGRAPAQPARLQQMHQETLHLARPHGGSAWRS